MGIRAHSNLPFSSSKGSMGWRCLSGRQGCPTEGLTCLCRGSVQNSRHALRKGPAKQRRSGSVQAHLELPSGSRGSCQGAHLSSRLLLHSATQLSAEASRWLQGGSKLLPQQLVRNAGQLLPSLPSRRLLESQEARRWNMIAAVLGLPRPASGSATARSAAVKQVQWALSALQITQDIHVPACDRSLSTWH